MGLKVKKIISQANPAMTMRNDVPTTTLMNWNSHTV